MCPIQKQSHQESLRNTVWFLRYLIISVFLMISTTQCNSKFWYKIKDGSSQGVDLLEKYLGFPSFSNFQSSQKKSVVISERITGNIENYGNHAGLNHENQNHFAGLFVVGSLSKNHLNFKKFFKNEK